MILFDLSRSARGVALAASAALLLVGACSRAPEPDAYAEPPPPPPGPNAELLGQGPPPPAYVPDDRPAYADRGPPPRYAETPPPPAYAAPGPQRPPVVIAMEPIPNPPEKPRRAQSHRRAHRAESGHTRRYAAAPPARAAKPRAGGKPEAPRKPPVVAQARPSAPARPAPTRSAPPKVALAPPAKPVAKPAAPALAKPPVLAKAPPPPAVKPAAKPPALAKPAVTPPLTAPQDRATKLASLQTALTQALAKAAKFDAPERFTAGQAAQVTLDIPAEFGDVVLSEAQKAGLSDVAASVNLTAALSGDGFSATPADTAAQPLMAGEPTRFTWQVMAMRGAKGPLHADMGANLEGAGSESLDLGTLKVADGTGGISPRIIGASLLVLIAALVVAWLARVRKAPPAKPAAAAAPPPPPPPAPEPKPAPAPEPVHAAEPPANDPGKG